jgi:hypothetical protein
VAPTPRCARRDRLDTVEDVSDPHSLLTSIQQPAASPSDNPHETSCFRNLLSTSFKASRRSERIVATNSLEATFLKLPFPETDFLKLQLFLLASRLS